ncbi:hypothetical protein OG905_00280 [Streptomyces sp. NBC_00322]|uniref:hypothetical protein n=1 Tax=Streptomyces sp. NBC_00322 TaxID=2975712 RepID=UPI002E28334C|nr:hypothetical protein [Streptomyces sp. NBC_00322]
MSTLVWVAVPAGLSSPSTARIRVMVVPRLGAGSLADLGLQDWPALLADASFELQVKFDDGIREADRAPVYDPVADSDAWHAFFDGGAGVIDEWTPKQQAAPQVRPTYSDARAVVTSYRECTSILSVPAPHGEAAAAVRQRIERWKAPLSPSVQVEEPLPPLPQAIDFHRAVATLREHPTVLQAIGLVFELSAGVDDLDVGTGPRFLRIRGTDLPVDVTSPWTKYDLAEDAFWPAPADGSSGIHRGVLDLTGVGLLDWAGATTPRWALSTLDVDGAVRALRTEARALDGSGERRPALPDLRTGGLMLIRPDRQSDFTARAGIAAGRLGAALGNAEFTAEDLVLGYRVDIRVGDDPDWRSLCERQAAYAVKAPDGRTITLGDSTRLEEGHVKPYAAVKTPDGRLHADEVVARWDGWSLTVPLVNLLGGTPGAEPNPAQAPPYEFRWSFASPDGRLPRLRFATRYQMRARIADLTGGGPGLDDPQGTADATDTVIYTRNDPIQPPRLSHDGTFSTGAAIDQMVIRSDLDLTAAQFHTANPQYPAVERRTLHPPTVSFALAEQHGVFDPKDPEDSRPEFTERTWKWALRALRAEGAGDPVGALPDPATSGISAHIPAAPGGLAAPITERTDWPSWPSADPKRVELSEQLTANPPIRLDWDGARLDIRLAKAEEAVLELSSTVRDGFLDHFAVKAWLDQPVDSPGIPRPPIDQWQATVQNGRHPLLSPVRRIHLVHAVRRPLAEPVWQLPPGAVTRAEHATNAVLRPVFSPTGLNTDSTGRLEISASWREWSNDGDHQQSVDHLHGETIARGDPPALTVRHEFGDSKHRKVTYTLNAISRFRAYFDVADPDKAFRLSRTQAPVTIPSSARPPGLALLSTTPSFRWQSQATATRIERSRSSHRLRVELASPWYETGEGERLAVLVADEAGAPAVPVTRLARDPVFASAPLPPLAAKSWFAGFSEPPTTSPDMGPSVWLVPYAVTREGDRWYADIEITPPPTAPSYAPFVRLALARFQPNSLPKLALSPVVVTDPVRLLPDRRLIIERTGPDLRLSLLGTNPNPPNRLEATLEEAHGPAGVLPSAIDLVDLTTPPAADVPAWRPLPSHTLTSNQPEIPSTLRMPSGTAPLRLRVREVERLDTPIASASPAELRDRTVFVDAALLPADWRPN